MLVTLLQPPPDVFATFDRVMLMREGRIVYHGPLNMVADYFADMGMPCPDDTDPADFYVDFLSDPELVWDRYVKRLRHEKHDPTFTPLITPPLTTDELVLHFSAFMHKNEWGIFGGVEGATAATPVSVAAAAAAIVVDFVAMLWREGCLQATARASAVGLEAKSESRDDMQRASSGTGAVIPRAASSVRRTASGVAVGIDEGKHVLGSYGVAKKSPLMSLDDPASKRMFEDKYAHGSWDQFKVLHARVCACVRAAGADHIAFVVVPPWQAVFGREVHLMKHNKQFVLSHIYNDVFMGLVVGSLFFNLHRESFQIRYGLFFLAMVHVMFSGLAEVPLIFNVRAASMRNAIASRCALHVLLCGLCVAYR